MKLSPQRLKYVHEYRAKNRERLLILQRAQSKKWRENNKEKVKSIRAKYNGSLKGQLKSLQYRRAYYKANPDKMVKYRKKLSSKMRTRIYVALHSRYLNKRGHTVELLGCSIEELKSFLTLKFLDGMTWENHGKWHIDHKRPCASFNLVDPAEQKLAFHYSNLQPLWAKDNLIKSSKYAKPL